ncbi:hypothetical protein [Tepidiphilus baoligensis]|uniref:hypothetical protein n=1 Tax=Tepidiphilus baoligensis TaxID=2698687 RepID=UPI0036D7CEFE
MLDVAPGCAAGKEAGAGLDDVWGEAEGGVGVRGAASSDAGSGSTVAERGTGGGGVGESCCDAEGRGALAGGKG